MLFWNRRTSQRRHWRRWRLAKCVPLAAADERINDRTRAAKDVASVVGGTSCLGRNDGWNRRVGTNGWPGDLIRKRREGPVNDGASIELPATVADRGAASSMNARDVEFVASDGSCRAKKLCRRRSLLMQRRQFGVKPFPFRCPGVRSGRRWIVFFFAFAGDSIADATVATRPLD